MLHESSPHHDRSGRLERQGQLPPTTPALPLLNRAPALCQPTPKRRSRHGFPYERNLLQRASRIGRQLADLLGHRVEEMPGTHYDRRKDEGTNGEIDLVAHPVEQRDIADNLRAVRIPANADEMTDELRSNRASPSAESRASGPSRTAPK